METLANFIKKRAEHSYGYLLAQIESLSPEEALAGSRSDWPDHRWGVGQNGSIAGIVYHVAAWKQMTLPLFQVGDQVRAGMAVAQIPDMRNWEVSAQIAEQDRGHLSLSQPARIEVVSMPGRTFRGKITNLGGTTGPPWERRFECKLSLDDPAAELRPGMSAQIVITMETMKNALWIPSQAMFERDGRSFVYAKANGSFVAKDVKLVRRSESQVVIDGLNDGEEISMTSPDQKEQKKPGGPGNAAKAVAK